MSLEYAIRRITKITDTAVEIIGWIDQDYNLFFKKRSKSSNKLSHFYFIWDIEQQKYVNEFGFILQDTGKLMIVDGYKEYFEIFINKQKK